VEPDPVDPSDPLGPAGRGALVRSARAAGAKAVASGRWLTDAIVDLAPRIPVRDLPTLVAHHGGATGHELARELIRNATRASAGVGAVSGAVMSAGQLVPPTWLAFPFELAIETALVAAIELKLVAELHEVYGRPARGAPAERATALVKAWAERRGITPGTLTRKGGLTDALGRSARTELTRLVRRRLMARFGRNISSLAPLFIGAVAGAEVNRRATRGIGEAVAKDLAAPV
jgi:hypothetical protein